MGKISMENSIDDSVANLREDALGLNSVANLQKDALKAANSIANLREDALKSMREWVANLREDALKSISDKVSIANSAFGMNNVVKASVNLLAETEKQNSLLQNIKDFGSLAQYVTAWPKIEQQKLLSLDTIMNEWPKIEQQKLLSSDPMIFKSLVDSEREQRALYFSQLMKESYGNIITDDVGTITEYLDHFNSGISDIEKLLEITIAPSVDKCFYRLLYANVITVLETYLSDAFISTVLHNPSFIRKMVENTPEFKKEKFPISDIYKFYDDMEEKVRDHLSKIIWHNLDTVKGMYKDTLNIDFPDDIIAIRKAIFTRHDIVHRNGKDLQGKEQEIDRQDVTNLITEVKELVQHVDSLLGKKLESS